METIAIIPLGPLTIPSILKLLIKRPGLPGGRFCVDPPPPPPTSLPKRGAKGSRRAEVSRTATGVTEGPGTELGTSEFATLNGLGCGGFAAEFGATDEEPLLPEPGVGLLAAPVPRGAPLEARVPPEAGFAAESPAGLTVPVVPFAAGPEGELGEEAAAGPIADAGGLIAEFVDAAGLELWGCFGDGAAAEGVFAPAAGFAGGGGFNALRTASGVAGACCAINGVANANQKTISQLARFAFRMISY